jgi:hypothetical protein
MDFSLTTLPVETALIFWTFCTWAMDCMLYIYLFDRVYLWRLLRRFIVLWESFFCFFYFFRRVFVVPSFSPRAASFFIFAREEGTK